MLNYQKRGFGFTPPPFHSGELISRLPPQFWRDFLPSKMPGLTARLLPDGR